MSNKFNIKRRPSIHDRDRDSITPEREAHEDAETSRQQQHAYYESGSELDDSQNSAAEDASYNINATFERSRRQHDSFNMSRSVPRTPERPKSTLPRNTSKYTTPGTTTTATTNAPINLMLLIAVGSIILGIVAYSTLGNSNVPSQIRRECTFKGLLERAPIQTKYFWQTLRVGIEMIVNKETDKPSVYLFLLQQSSTPAATRLINDIAAHAASCFGQRMHPVHMNREDFTSTQAINDYGYAIQQYKSKIKQGNVILILNLNEIPAEAARALHTICDTYSPIAEDVVIFLTLTVTDISASQPPAQLATDTLETLWGSKIERNELDPLITRVTDQVVPVQS